MYTFQDLYTIYTTITKDSSSTNITNGKLWINDFYKRVLNMADWPFLEDEWYADSVASQESYRLPHNYGRLLDVWYVILGNKYYPDEIISSREWTEKTQLSTTSDYPDYFHIFADYIHFYPAFTSDGIDIHVRYLKTVKNMTADDYTTGTVSITNNTDKVTGSGTAFTKSMEGRWIKVSGDDNWYEIDTYSSATELILAKTYEGDTLFGASYVIAELPLIPEGFQDILWQRAASMYFMIKGEENRSKFYKDLADEGLLLLKSRYQTKTTLNVFRRDGREIRNPNDYPENLSEA